MAVTNPLKVKELEELKQYYLPFLNSLTKTFQLVELLVPPPLHQKRFHIPKAATLMIQITLENEIRVAFGANIPLGRPTNNMLKQQLCKTRFGQLVRLYPPNHQQKSPHWLGNCAELVPLRLNWTVWTKTLIFIY